LRGGKSQFESQIVFFGSSSGISKVSWDEIEHLDEFPMRFLVSEEAGLEIFEMKHKLSRHLYGSNRSESPRVSTK
jgi:hypothetical protein